MAAKSRKRRGYTSLSSEGEINLTPLLDVIFNLIFFFILATTIRQEDNFFDLTLPESRQAPPQQVTEIIPEITVTADGHMALNGQFLSEDELLSELRAIVERDDVTRAVLSAEGTATMNQAARATDLLYEAGIRETMQRVQKGE